MKTFKLMGLAVAGSLIAGSALAADGLGVGFDSFSGGGSFSETLRSTKRSLSSAQPQPQTPAPTPVAPQPRKSGKACLVTKLGENICVGNEVVDLGRYDVKGKVKMLFSNGVAIVEFNLLETKGVSVDDLSKSFKCLKNGSGTSICVGDAVLNPMTQKVSRVKVVYGNGRAIISDGFFGIDDVGIDKLLKPLGNK